MIIEAVVLDVLGTLVDEPSGLRAALRRAFPGSGEVDGLLTDWQAHIADAQERIVAGDRPYAPSHVLDDEAAAFIGARAGVSDADVLARLSRDARRLPAWPDSAAGLAGLADHLPVLGLSNASPSALLQISAHAGLRFHQALSADAAGTYKPDPAVYRLAVELVGRPADRLLMVAAHAWDLRGAQGAGLRTAYVPRTVGDPPAPGDRFDLVTSGLPDLVRRLTAQSSAASRDASQDSAST